MQDVRDLAEKATRKGPGASRTSWWRTAAHHDRSGRERAKYRSEVSAGVGLAPGKYLARYRPLPALRLWVVSTWPPLHRLALLTLLVFTPRLGLLQLTFFTPAHAVSCGSAPATSPSSGRRAPGRGAAPAA